MSLYDQIRTRMIECMKNGKKGERDILKTVLGEVQLKSEREGKKPFDEMVEKTLNTFKDNATSCTVEGILDKMGPIDITEEMKVNSERAKKEISLYEKYLPSYETVESIIELLLDHSEKLNEAKSDGVATGMAMGILKKTGKKIKGLDVVEAVKNVRGQE